MKKKTHKIPDSYHNLKAMLTGIPKDLWNIFLPETDDGMAMLDADILAQEARDIQRNKVMEIQKLCGFMLRPNEQIRDVIVRAKKAGLSEDKLPRDKKTDNPNSL